MVSLIPGAIPTPTPRPQDARFVSRAISSNGAPLPDARDIGSRSVMLFDRCMPQCETRDPAARNVAAHDVPTNDIAPVLIGYAGPNVGQQMIANARHLVDIALSGPSMMFDKGRELVADLGPNRP